MSPRPASFTQAEITRAVRALVAAGLPVAGVRVDASGFTVLTEREATPAGHRPGEALDAADVVAKRLAGNGQD